jgi:hypothetical protein
MTIPYKEDFDEQVKCGGCNYRVSRKFSFSEDVKKDGLCGLCFMEMIIDEEMEIFPRGAEISTGSLLP